MARGSGGNTLPRARDRFEIDVSLGEDRAALAPLGEDPGDGAVSAADPAATVLDLHGASSSLRFAATPDGGSLSGEVDLSTWELLAAALDVVVDTGERRGGAVLDVSGLSFVDGHCVGLIAAAGRRVGAGRPLVIRGATPGLVLVADILRLGRVPGLVIEGPGDGGR
jgi:anti-anti-sigma regulatory factor